MKQRADITRAQVRTVADSESRKPLKDVRPRWSQFWSHSPPFKGVRGGPDFLG